VVAFSAGKPDSTFAENAVSAAVLFRAIRGLLAPGLARRARAAQPQGHGDHVEIDLEKVQIARHLA
jgi:hypothetical protein